MAGKRTARCAFCGDTFTVERRSGPTPSYCSQAHRQRAYEQRRRTTRSDSANALADELRTLRGRISWLEHANTELARERDEAIAEMNRLQHQLHPLSPAVQRLVGPTDDRRHPPPEPSPPRRRRWKPSR